MTVDWLQYVDGGESTARGLTPGQQRFVMEDVLGLRQPKPGQPTIIEAEATNPIGAALRGLLRALGRQGRPVTAEAVEGVMRVPDEVMQGYLDDMARKMAARARQRPSIEQPSFIPSAQGGTASKLEKVYPQRAPQATDPINEGYYYYTRQPKKTETVFTRRNETKYESADQAERTYVVSRPNPNDAAQEIGLNPTGVPQIDIANLATKLGRVPSEADLAKYLDLRRSRAWTSDDWDAAVEVSEGALARARQGLSSDELALADEIATRFDVPYDQALVDARATLQRRATFKEELHAADELRTNPALSPDEALLIAKAKTYQSPGQVNYQGMPLSRTRMDVPPRKPEAELGEDFQSFLRDKWGELFQANLKSVVSRRTGVEEKALGLRPGQGPQPTAADSLRARELTEAQWPAMRFDLIETKRRVMQGARVNVAELRKSYVEKVNDLRSQVRAIDAELTKRQQQRGGGQQSLLLRKRQLESMVQAAEDSLRGLPKSKPPAGSTSSGIRDQMVYMRDQRQLWKEELDRVDELTPEELDELYPVVKGDPYKAAKRFIEEQIDAFDKEISSYINKYYKGAQDPELIRGKGGIARPTEDMVLRRIERAEAMIRDEQKMHRLVRAAELREERYAQWRTERGYIGVDVEVPRTPGGGNVDVYTTRAYVHPSSKNFKEFMEGVE